MVPRSLGVKPAGAFYRMDGRARISLLASWHSP
jgi:hypothetical protein